MIRKVPVMLVTSLMVISLVASTVNFAESNSFNKFQINMIRTVASLMIISLAATTVSSETRSWWFKWDRSNRDTCLYLLHLYLYLNHSLHNHYLYHL